MSGPVKNRVGTNVRGNECLGFIFKHCGTNTFLTLKLAVIWIIISDVFNGVPFQQLFFHQYYNIQCSLLVQWFKLDMMLYFNNCYKLYLT